MTLITELGGYKRKHGRNAEGRGNAPNCHVDQACRCPGGGVPAPVLPPDNGGQHIQQYNRPRLRHISPGHPVRREHHGSADGFRELAQEPDPRLAAREPCRGRLRLLALQPHVPGEGPSLVLQRVLHPERFPADQSSHSRAPRGPFDKILPNGG